MSTVLEPGERELHLISSKFHYRLILHRRLFTGGGDMLLLYPDIKRGCTSTKKRLAEMRQKARALAEMTNTAYREDHIYPGDE